MRFFTSLTYLLEGSDILGGEGDPDPVHLLLLLSGLAILINKQISSLLFSIQVNLILNKTLHFNNLHSFKWLSREGPR